MKNSFLENLKAFELPKNITKYVNGGSQSDLDNCKATAERDGNDWLIPVCEEILGGEDPNCCGEQ